MVGADTQYPHALQPRALSQGLRPKSTWTQVEGPRMGNTPTKARAAPSDAAVGPKTVPVPGCGWGGLQTQTHYVAAARGQQAAADATKRAGRRGTQVSWKTRGLPAAARRASLSTEQNTLRPNSWCSLAPHDCKCPAHLRTPSCYKAATAAGQKGHRQKQGHGREPRAAGPSGVGWLLGDTTKH